MRTFLRHSARNIFQDMPTLETQDTERRHIVTLKALTPLGTLKALHKQTIATLAHGHHEHCIGITAGHQVLPGYPAASGHQLFASLWQPEATLRDNHVECRALNVAVSYCNNHWR
jgi:hypothetical protein